MLHRPVREGLGPAYLAGFARALAARRGLRVRDGRRPLPRPGRPRAPARAPCATAAPTSRWARATCPAAASPTGAPCGASSAAAARGTRGAPSACEVRDLTGGFKCFRAEVLRGDRPAERALARLRLPGRADLPRDRARASASSRCRSSSATARWGRRRCRGGSPPRRRGSCRSCAGAPRTCDIRPRSAQGAAVAAPNRHRVNVSELALVQGMDDTRAALRRWHARAGGGPAPVGRSAPRRSRSRCCWPCWIVAHARHARTRRGYLVPGVNEPGDLGAVGHVLFRNSLVLALHAMACVAGFIAGSSLPLQAEHHRGWWRTVHEKAGPAGDRLRRRRDDLLARAPRPTSWAARRRRSSAQLDIGRATLHARPCCPTRCPSSSRCSCRWPPGCSPAAARRWNELLAATARDHRDRRPRARRWPRSSRSTSGRTCCGSPRRSCSAQRTTLRRTPVTTLCIVTSQTPARDQETDMAGNIIEVTDANFQAEVIESETPVLVDFWAPWCGPCRVVAPVLEEIAQRARRPADRQAQRRREPGQTAANFEVLSIPTLILFKNGADGQEGHRGLPQEAPRGRARARPGLAPQLQPVIRRPPAPGAARALLASRGRARRRPRPPARAGAARARDRPAPSARSRPSARSTRCASWPPRAAMRRWLTPRASSA